MRRIRLLAPPPGAAVHVAHHKVGTAWWESILRGFAGHYGLRFVQPPIADRPGPADICFFSHSRAFHRDDFGDLPFRGTHMIRDPRDVLISGYFYHLWTEERWANEPKERYGGRSYREELNRRDRNDGLLLEMERMCRNDQLRDMLAWDYSQPEFLELKYEDVISDESRWFERVFRHYGFRDREVQLGLDIADSKSFSRVSGRKVGEIGSANHLRSGRPGEWREHLTAEHLARWQELAGDALTRLGYDPQ